MAPSSNSEHHRQQRPAPLVRQHSSFLGTIKNIVTAPLTWFGHHDDDATSGKRRRPVECVPTEPALEIEANGHAARDHDEDIDDSTRRSKRMRLQSPPRTTQHYLDPPATALQRVHPPPRRTSVVPRASSAVLPSSRSRATLSPLRHHGVARTMSIDPPTLTLRRDTSSSAFNFGPSTSDMDMAVDSTRDVSMPPSPLSPRPSFRMRSSLTPQPQFAPSRHQSEPPPLNALISNPVFIHPPAQTHDPTPARTLGSLAESQRTARSPSKQRRSPLLFTSNSHDANDENDDAPAQRALNQLDVYKTPLLPTRLRSSNLPSSSSARTPAMFKSHRSSHLILMPDDRERLGRKGNDSGKSPVVNETKPYAGEGGMKKLLARHKLEAEKEGIEQKGESGEVDEETTPRHLQASSVPVETLSIPLPPPKDSDWFSTIPPPLSTSTSGSSLRVGRTKTSRNHIQRPSRARFSAVYEEEPDDAMDEEDDRRKERQMLDEAAKKVPMFQNPVDFSFAKDVPPVKPSDLENAKEPPISSLPFSFAKAGESGTSKPAVGLIVPPKLDAASKPQATSILGSSAAILAPAAPPDRVPTAEPKHAISVPAPSSFFSSAPTPALTVPVSSAGGIPNFFANSQALKDAALPMTPPLNFGGSAFSGTPPSKPVQPMKDNENPFWDGDKKKASEELKPSQILFQGSSPAFPPLNMAPEDAASDFSFSKPPGGQPAASVFNTSTTAAEAPKLPFSFGPASEAKKPEIEMVAPKPLFGMNGTLPGTDANSNLFGGITNPTIPPQPTPSPLSLSFGAAPADRAGSVAAEPPNPFSFGQAQTTHKDKEVKPASAFSFGQPASADNDKPSASFSFGPSAPANKGEEVKPATAFTFGAAPSSPPVAPAPDIKTSSTPAFTFGPSSTSAAPAPTPIFGFGGGGSTTADVSSKPFMFGHVGALAAPERPVTPPKDNEVRMEESPTREMQQPNGMNKVDSRPTLGGGFSFSTSTSTSNGIFGNAASSSQPAPFTFGAAPTSNPFAPKDTKIEEPNGFGGFGQLANAPPAITTSFSFGMPKATEEARPASAGGFTFGTPTSTTAPVPAFSFGASTASNPFGQPAGGSTPSSPSTFNQPSPFAFGSSAPAATSAFSFGSQPASPAAGANLALPQHALSSGFGNAGGFGAAPSPSSPFSGPIALAPSTSGGAAGSLFTIGAAPPPVQGPPGPRAIKKLPRRGAVKR